MPANVTQIYLVTLVAKVSVIQKSWYILLRIQILVTILTVKPQPNSSNAIGNLQPAWLVWFERFSKSDSYTGPSFLVDFNLSVTAISNLQPARLVWSERFSRSDSYTGPSFLVDFNLSVTAISNLQPAWLVWFERFSRSDSYTGQSLLADFNLSVWPQPDIYLIFNAQSTLTALQYEEYLIKIQEKLWFPVHDVQQFILKENRGKKWSQMSRKGRNERKRLPGHQWGMHCCILTYSRPKEQQQKSSRYWIISTWDLISTWVNSTSLWVALNNPNFQMNTHCLLMITSAPDLITTCSAVQKLCNRQAFFWGFKPMPLTWSIATWTFHMSPCLWWHTTIILSVGHSAIQKIFIFATVKLCNPDLENGNPTFLQDTPCLLITYQCIKFVHKSTFSGNHTLAHRVWTKHVQ